MRRPLSLLALSPLALVIAGGCSDPAGSSPPDKCNSTQWSEAASFQYLDAEAQPVDPATAPVRICQPRAPDLATDGTASCAVLTAKKSATCSCDSKFAESEVSADHVGVVDVANQSMEAQANGWNCYCELPQLTGDQATACRMDPTEPLLASGQPVSGFCYVGTSAPAAGDPSILKDCAPTEQRAIRIVGAAKPPKDEFVFVVCVADLCNQDTPGE